MRRIAVFTFVILLCIIIAGLCKTAINPEDFSGKWYSSEDQDVYLFQDGLIFSDKYTITLSGTELITGAYTYCRDAIFLYAEGVEGLEMEKELYLVHNRDTSFLCENKDGSGKIYFIRYKQ